MFFWRFSINRSTKTNLLLSNWPAHAFFLYMCCRSKYSYVLPKQVRSKYAHANHHPLLALISSSTPTPHIHWIFSVCIYISCSHKWNHLETFQPFKHSNLWPKTQAILTTAYEPNCLSGPFTAGYLKKTFEADKTSYWKMRKDESSRLCILPSSRTSTKRNISLVKKEIYIRW